MTDASATISARAVLPEILWAADLQVALGLPSERAARDLIRNHGIPCVRLGGRMFVMRDSLVAYMHEHEERLESIEEMRARADEAIRQIAPTARKRRQGRKPPGTGRD